MDFHQKPVNAAWANEDCDRGLVNATEAGKGRDRTCKSGTGNATAYLSSSWSRRVGCRNRTPEGDISGSRDLVVCA
ncbi:hypothetical protein Taro_016484 [Colocasia esculenta]|uniref:Uncharacterized protein n=1 Tax=Colocasia esculenta TaxID=4460 RepID=A0A843UKF8_COLES|nr:hypothetical protein [Colocasia esculenta]